ncbi:MAG: hypothetical protein FWC97_05855 [Treponema sp.]|nr:hypothetical protein [Treponema sp.]
MNLTRFKKRLNIIILVFMITFFAGSAFAYVMGETPEINGIASVRSGFELIIDESRSRIENPHSVPATIHEAKIIGDRFGISFDVDFDAPGQSVEFIFYVQNVSPHSITINNIELTGKDNSEIPEWLKISNVASNEGDLVVGRAIPAHGNNGSDGYFRIRVSWDSQSVQSHSINEEFAFDFLVHSSFATPTPTPHPPVVTSPTPSPTPSPESTHNGGNGGNGSNNGNGGEGGGNGNNSQTTPRPSPAPTPSPGPELTPSPSPTPGTDPNRGSPSTPAPEFPEITPSPTPWIVTENDPRPGPGTSQTTPPTSSVTPPPQQGSGSPGNPSTGDNRNFIWLVLSSIGLGISGIIFAVSMFRAKRHR